jgi:hypothetical protein
MSPTLRKVAHARTMEYVVKIGNAIRLARAAFRKSFANHPDELNSMRGRFFCFVTFRATAIATSARLFGSHRPKLAYAHSAQIKSSYSNNYRDNN